MKHFTHLLTLLVLLACGGCHSNDPAPASLPPAYAGPPAPADAVFYEVNLRALQPNPTFAGVTARLDSMKRLGVNVVWLMPVYPVGQLRQVPPLGSPYAVRDYTAVNPEFGSLADFQQFVTAAHSRGLAVVVDWVANHTAWDHAWITQHPDWYTQDGAGQIVSPPGTGWNDVADLNYASADMRAAMIRAMKYWATEQHVDGFRCDAADYVPFDFWKQALDSLRAIPNHPLLLLAEGARTDHFTAGFQLNYAWGFYSQLKNVFGSGQSAALLFSAHDAEYNGLPAGARKLRFTTNHDETCWDNPPVVIFGGTSGALAASVAALYLGGTPLLYNGQEVGCPTRLPLFDRSAIDWTLNPAMARAYRQLLQLYTTTPALRTGSLARYPSTDVLAFERQQGAERVLVLVNVRNRAVTYPLPAALVGTTWKNALTTAATAAPLPATLTLAPYEYQVLRRP